MLAAAVHPEAAMISLLAVASCAPNTTAPAHHLGPEPGQLMADRGTGVPCIGLALAASGIIWAGFGCPLALLVA
jgi:hypothetical protein